MKALKYVRRFGRIGTIALSYDRGEFGHSLTHYKTFFTINAIIVIIVIYLLHNYCGPKHQYHPSLFYNPNYPPIMHHAYT